MGDGGIITRQNILEKGKTIHIMVKSDIISATKANRLYWLGRYEMRVYQTLHQMNKCYDKMIDGKPEDYRAFWKILDAMGNYSSTEEFTLGMLYDEDNPSSVISAQRFAMDNAILLREDIMSETLSYLEMSIALMKRCKAEGDTAMVKLQPVIDWTLAFWGSAEQRVQNHKALSLMLTGRNIENLDILLRFGYPFRRIALAYESMKRYASELDDMIDDHIQAQLDALLTEEQYTSGDAEYKFKLIKFVNQLVRV